MTALPDSGVDEWSQLPIPPVATGAGQWRCVICGCKHDELCLCKSCGFVEGKSSGNHCADCGQHECLCCEGCDTYPCCCEENEGGSKFRTTPPWVERGQQIMLHATEAAYESWVTAWPILNDPILGYAQTDPCQAAADFYILDALKAGLVNTTHECDRHCKFAELVAADPRVRAAKLEATRIQGMLVDHLDALFSAYVDMACGGELRHHPAVGGHCVSGNRRRAWAGWKHVRDVVGPQALLDAGDMFRDWGKSGNTGYGGPLWAGPAETLYQRVTGRITPHQWVDRVFTFVHNGGVFLNKLNWATKNHMGFDLNRLQSDILPAHAMDNFSLLLKVCSRDVARLWDEEWTAINRLRSSHGIRTTVNFRSNPRRRIVCRYCNSNPARGHAITCNLVANGHLKATGWQMQSAWQTVVAEDQWHNWSWSTWEMEPAVKPDGSIVMSENTQVFLHFSINAGYQYAEAKVTLPASKAITHVFTVKNVLPYVVHDHNAECNWSLDVYSSGGGVLVPLGSIAGKATKDVDHFMEISVDCGLVLAAACPSINWDKVFTPYMAKLNK